MDDMREALSSRRSRASRSVRETRINRSSLMFLAPLLVAWLVTKPPSFPLYVEAAETLRQRDHLIAVLHVEVLQGWQVSEAFGE